MVILEAGCLGDGKRTVANQEMDGYKRGGFVKSEKNGFDYLSTVRIL